MGALGREAIRNDTEFNEVDRGVQASVVTAMGRMAAHTGQVITYDQALNWEHEFSPDTDKLTLASKSPLMPNEDGSYPIPEPGRKIRSGVLSRQGIVTSPRSTAKAPKSSYSRVSPWRDCGGRI